MQKEAFRDKCSFVQTSMCVPTGSVQLLAWGGDFWICSVCADQAQKGWEGGSVSDEQDGISAPPGEDGRTVQNRKSSEECVGKRILCKNISHLPGHNSYIRVVMVMIIVLMVRSDSGCSLAPRRTPFYWPHSRVTPLRCCIVYVHCRVALDINCKA